MAIRYFMIPYFMMNQYDQPYFMMNHEIWYHEIPYGHTVFYDSVWPYGISWNHEIWYHEIPYGHTVFYDSMKYRMAIWYFMKYCMAIRYFMIP